MIRRYFPIWLPVMLVATLAATSYKFWRVESVGSALTTLPVQALAGHEIRVSHASATDPATTPCAWRVHLTPLALGKLGGIELSYSEGDAPPQADAWIPLPTSGTENAFVANLKPPASSAARLHLRGIRGGGSIFWDLKRRPAHD